MDSPIPPETVQQIADHVFAGRKIQAIKLYREHSGKDLKDSKEFVEALEAELRTKEPARFTAPPAAKGCLGMVAVLSIGALAAGVVLAMVYQA